MRIHVQGEEQFVAVPVSALVIHENRQGRAIVTRHDIQRTGEAFALGSGQTLDRLHLERLNRSLNGSALHFIPGHVLARSASVTVWWELAQARVLHFDGASADVQAMSGLAVPFPPLVFVADGAALSVFALQQDARPDVGTPLMRAPTYNTYADGGVCLGSTVRPDPNDPAPEHAWSAAFFRSTFTHATAVPFLAWGGTYSELLKAARKKKRFPPEALRPSGKTLGTLLGGLAERAES